jgi:predicted RNA-binding Zn ribbon-like protein
MTPPPATHPANHRHPVGLETAVEFINTLELEHGLPLEHLTTLDAAIEWFGDQGVFHGDRASWPHTVSDPADAGRALDRIRAARAAMRSLADAIADDRTVPAGALDVINRLLRRREVIELVPSADGCAVGHRHVGDSIDDALARMAERLVDVVAGGHEDRLRICANANCQWVFYDTSRTGRRRWCDMATCGNRAKAARHRARLRTEDSLPPDT